MGIPVITVFAPTATGKTALALNLFGEGSRSFFKGKAELISADSMQVYRKLDIGTAKPGKEEQKLLRHHLVDILDFDEQFTVSDFVEKADFLCGDIYSRGKIPFVAGGTGFYIRSFLLGLPETPPSDGLLREELKKRIKIEGKEVFYKKLKDIDPASAEKINPNDEYRIIRALEVFMISGKPRSAFEMNARLREKFDFCTIILERSRNSLYGRIDRRVDSMFASGLEKEVMNLIENEGARSWMPGMKAIGYREWFSFFNPDEKDFLKSREDKEKAVEKIRAEIKRSSRKYAKKQYTFMNDIPSAKKINADDEEKMFFEVSETIKDFLLKNNCHTDLGAVQK